MNFRNHVNRTTEMNGKIGIATKEARISRIDRVF